MSCSSCSLGEFRAERLEAWKTAYQALTAIEWDERIGPADVLLLAMFLEGVADD